MPQMILSTLGFCVRGMGRIRVQLQVLRRLRDGHSLEIVP
jgi:hypothetical protein